MKIRNGFVSNSSSSSFVVAFPNKPETAEQVKELLWPHLGEVENPYDENDQYDAIGLASIVLNEINDQDETIDEALRGWIEHSDIARASVQTQMIHYLEQDLYSSKLDWGNADDRKKIDDIYKEIDDLREAIKSIVLEDLHARAALRFGKDNYQLFTFEFSDENGQPYSTLEHGYTFDNLPYIKISRH